jgi:hypothetical protein
MIVLSPGFSQSKSEKKKLKEEKSLKEFEMTKSLINSHAYMFVANWAGTQKGRRIDLTTNPNSLKIEKDQADIYLPYFGIVHSSSYGLKDEGGIVFNGTVNNYKVEINDEKQKITISFSAKGKNDQFDFTLTVFKNKNSSLLVYSNIRNSINYDGNLMDLEKEE